MPEEGEYVWFVYWQTHDKSGCLVRSKFTHKSPNHITEFQAGFCFPDTPSGRLGAELRAKQGILPPKRQPAPGRFVPESEIQKLRDVANGGYLSDLPFIIRSFLKAIDKEGGQNE